MGFEIKQILTEKSTPTTGSLGCDDQEPKIKIPQREEIVGKIIQYCQITLGITKPQINIQFKDWSLPQQKKMFNSLFSLRGERKLYNNLISNNVSTESKQLICKRFLLRLITRVFENTIFGISEDLVFWQRLGLKKVISSFINLKLLSMAEVVELIKFADYFVNNPNLCSEILEENLGQLNSQFLDDFKRSLLKNFSTYKKQNLDFENPRFSFSKLLKSLTKNTAVQSWENVLQKYREEHQLSLDQLGIPDEIYPIYVEEFSSKFYLELGRNILGEQFKEFCQDFQLNSSTMQDLILSLICFPEKVPDLQNFLISLFPSLKTVDDKVRNEFENKISFFRELLERELTLSELKKQLNWNKFLKKQVTSYNPVIFPGFLDFVTSSFLEDYFTKLTPKSNAEMSNFQVFVDNYFPDRRTPLIEKPFDFSEPVLTNKGEILTELNLCLLSYIQNLLSDILENFKLPLNDFPYKQIDGGETQYSTTFFRVRSFILKHRNFQLIAKSLTKLHPALCKKLGFAVNLQEALQKLYLKHSLNIDLEFSIQFIVGELFNSVSESELLNWIITLVDIKSGFISRRAGGQSTSKHYLKSIDSYQKTHGSDYSDYNKDGGGTYNSAMLIPPMYEITAQLTVNGRQEKVLIPYNNLTPFSRDQDRCALTSVAAQKGIGKSLYSMLSLIMASSNGKKYVWHHGPKGLSLVDEEVHRKTSHPGAISWVSQMRQTMQKSLIPPTLAMLDLINKYTRYTKDQ